MKKICQCCLAALLAIIIAMPALAEENLYDHLLPLLDAAAARNISTGSAAAPYVGVRPMGAELSPDGSAVVVLGDLYRAKAQLDTLTPEAYGEVQWLDQRVVAELQRDENGSWQVTSFRLDAELLMEDAAQAYFEEAMRTYRSELLGFYVQYPAVFEKTEETKNGMRAQYGEASFLCERVVNADGASLSKLVAQQQILHPDARVTVNEANGVSRVAWTANGVNTADVYAVSNDWVYHVQLCWTDALNADFVRYSEYVMNSLCVDELGIG